MKENGKILIIDDNIDTVELLKKRLRSEGYDTAEAHDGEAGLNKVEEYEPDLILLDVMMPKLNGYEVCNRLKTEKKTNHIPILMLTAKDAIPDKIKGLNIGADDYMTKPFNYKELSARIKSLLEKKDAKEKLVEEKKVEALEDMLDQVSHEILNPLVSVGGFARRVFKSLPEDSDNRKYMDIILKNVTALEKMVKQLGELKSATLSYIEAYDINEIIINVLKEFDQTTKQNKIDVKTSLMDAPPLIYVDRENLSTAIKNVVENGIEAMDGEKKVLKIITLVNKESLEIHVSDTGRGISRDKIKNIYNPFVTSKTYGPGLGLTFTLKTIQNHKGMILVESEKGLGTTFVIRLPIRRSGTSIS